MRISLPADESATDGRVRIIRGGKVVGTLAIEIAGGQTKTFKVAAQAQDADRARKGAGQEAPGDREDQS